MQVTAGQLHNLNQLHKELPLKLVKGVYASKAEHWDICNYCVIGFELSRIGVDDAALIQLSGAIDEDFEMQDLRDKLSEHLGLTIDELAELQHANDKRDREAVMDVLVDLIRKKEKMLVPDVVTA